MPMGTAAAMGCSEILPTIVLFPDKLRMTPNPSGPDATGRPVLPAKMAMLLLKV